MYCDLDARIREANALQEATQVEWHQKHMRAIINGKQVWLSMEVPDEVSKVLSHLPEEQEDKREERLHQIKTRLSEEELETFEMLVKASGLSQGEYIRGMVLNGHLEITQTSQVDADALDKLTSLSAELGRIAGMVRMTVIVNKEVKTLTGVEKLKLETQMRELRRIQGRIQALAEEIHGNLQAQNQ